MITISLILLRLDGVDKSRRLFENDVKEQLVPKFGENIVGQIAIKFLMYDS